jgi:hypothetical protein
MQYQSLYLRVIRATLEPQHSQQFEQLQKKFANPQEFQRPSKIEATVAPRDIPPSNSVMLKGLSQTVTEDEVLIYVYIIL